MSTVKGYALTIFMFFCIVFLTPAIDCLASNIIYTGSNSICSGQSLLLSAENPPPGSTFAWLKDGTIIPGATASSYAATESGNYSVRVTTAGIDDDSPAVTVTLNPLPDGSFTFTNDSQVSGTTIQFTSSTSAGTAPFSYQWDFGDGQSSGDANPTHVFNSIGCSNSSYIVTLTITDATGCSRTLAPKSINVLPKPEVTIADTDTFFPFGNCENSPTAANPNYTLTIANTSPSASCINSYSLDWGDGTVQNGLSNSSFPLTHTYTQLGAFNLKITATGANGSINSKTYVVANQTNPAGGLGTLGSTTGLCAPASVPFVISNWQNNSPGTIYILQYGDGFSETFTHPLNTTNTDQTVYHNYTTSSCPDNSFTATLIVKNACDETPYTAGNIQVRIQPSANFTLPTQTCDKQNICFTNTTAEGTYGSCNSATNYSWDFGDPSSSNNTASTKDACHIFSAPGTYTVTLTASNPCGTTVKTQTVVVSPLPVMTSAATAIVCTGTAVNLPLTSDIPAAFKWVAMSNPNVFGESTSVQSSSTISNILTNNTTTAQQVIYTVTPVSTTGTCSGTPQTVTITVNPKPASPGVTPLINYCVGEAAIDLTATVLPGHTLNWYLTSTGGIASSTAPTPSTLATGTTNYYVSQTSTATSCESARALIQVKVNPIPIAPVATTNIAYCQNQTTAALSATASSGNTLRWYNVATGGTVLASAPIPNSAIVGSISYYVSQISSSGCESPRTAINVMINSAPSAPLVTASLTYCQGETATPLTATTDPGNTLKWYITATGGTPSLTAPTPNTAIPGTKNYYVTQSTSNCESQRSTITVQVNPLPAAPLVTTPITYCISDVAVPLSAAATVSGNTLKWYTVAIGGTATSTAPTPSTLAAGTVNYYVSQVSTNGCEGPRAMITVNTSNPLTITNTQSTNPVTCNGSNGSITLSGLPANTAIAVEFKKNGGLFNRVITTNAAGDLILTNLAAGSYSDIIVRLSACSATVSGAFILTDPAPPAVPTLGGNTVLCTGETLSLTSSSAGAGATYQWTGPASFSSNLQNPTRANVLTSHSGTYTLTITQNNCSVTQTIQVNVNPKPVLSSSLTAQAICTNSIFNYTPTSQVSGTVFTWSRAAILGITNAPTSGTDNPAEVLINETNAPISVPYSFTLTANGCSTTQTVLATVYPTLVNIINNPTSPICAGQLVVINGSAVTGGTGVYQYVWESSADNISWSVIPNQQARDLTIALPNTLYVRRIVTSGPCSLASNSVRVGVQPAITNNTISGVQSICTGRPVSIIAGSTPSGADGNFMYKWQSSTNEINWFDIAGETGINFQPPVLTASTYYRRVATSNICTGAQQSQSNTIKITVNPDSKAEFTASSVSGCTPFNLSQVINVVPYADRNLTYEWFANGLKIGTGSSFPGYVINTDGANVTIKLVTTSKFGCESAEKEITFSTVKSVDATFTKDQNQGCGPLTVKFTNTTSATPGIQYLWNFGNGIVSTAAQPGDITFNPHPQNRDTTYIVTLKAFTDCRENTFVDSVLVRSKPLAVFSPDVTTGCSPLKINISNQSRGVAATYTFDFGNGERVVKTDKQAFDYTYVTTKADTFTMKLYTTNECGTDSTSYDIVVFPNSVVPELVVDGNKAFGCAPFTVDFKNNSVGANSFTWDYGDGSTVVSSSAPETQRHTFTKPGVYTVTLSATNGCSSAQTTEIITVYAPPVANFFTDKAQYCVNGTIAFQNQPEVNTSYLWDFGDGATSNQLNPEHSFKDAKDHQVKLTAIKTFPDGSNCSKTITVPVKVLALPSINITSNLSEINCVPFTLIAAANSASVSGAEWDFGDIKSPVNRYTGLTTQHTFETAGTYRVIAKFFNLAGCVDSNIIIVKVTEKPVAKFSASSNFVCGTSGKLTFKNETTYPAGTSISYQWMIDNTLVSSAADFSHTFNVPSGSLLPYQYQVKLIALNSNGCTDTVTQMVQFNPLPHSDFIASPTSSCPPFKVNITNKSRYSDQYNWYVNNRLVSTGATPNIILEESNTSYTIKLVTANIYGCSTDSFSRTISTLPRTVADFQVQDSISCNGRLDIKITNNSIGASSYTWDFGDGSAIQSGLAPAHTYGRPGTFILKLIANGICPDTASIPIKIAPTPKAAFIAPKTSSCTFLKVNFQNISTNTTAWLWDFGDGTYSTEKSPEHYYTYENSPFTVTLVAFGEYGCIDTLEMKNYITVTAPPKATFETVPDSIVKIPDFTFSFLNKSSGNPIKFRWNFGDGKSSQEENPTHTYPAIGKYSVELIVINKEGCSDTVVNSVEIMDVPGKLFVPNAFEPGNMSGKVNVFKPAGTGMTKYSIRVFDKWGHLLWQSDKLNELGEPVEAWDGTLGGKELPQGVYIWNIEASFINGTEWKGMKYEHGPTRKSGPIHLIR